MGNTQKLPEAEDQPPEPQSELLELEPQSEPPPEAKDQPDPDELEPLWKGSKSSRWCEPEFENSVDHRRKSPRDEPVYDPLPVVGCPHDPPKFWMGVAMTLSARARAFIACVDAASGSSSSER